jgi:hypothetical protein
MLYTILGQGGVSVEIPGIKLNHFIHVISPEMTKKP